MKRMTIGAIALGLLAGSAMAQNSLPDYNESDEAKAKRKENQAIDRQYRTTVDRMRGEPATTKADPWSNMRGPADSNAKR